MQLKNNTLIMQLKDSTSLIYAASFNAAFASLKSTNTLVTKEQEKLISHLLRTITEYEFSLIDANNDKVVTQLEYRSLVDTIFKNPED